jgi:hypothetical protein
LNALKDIGNLGSEKKSYLQRFCFVYAKMNAEGWYIILEALLTVPPVLREDLIIIFKLFSIYIKQKCGFTLKQVIFRSGFVIFLTFLVLNSIVNIIVV